MAVPDDVFVKILQMLDGPSLRKARLAGLPGLELHHQDASPGNRGGEEGD